MLTEHKKHKKNLIKSVTAIRILASCKYYIQDSDKDDVTRQIVIGIYLTM